MSVPQIPLLYSSEAEQQVLGALLLDAGAIGRVIRAGGAALFHHGVHAEIFRSIERKTSRGDLVSPITIKAALEGTGLLDEVGGPKYLASIAATAIGTAALPGYVDLLSEYSRKRALSEAASNALALLSRGEATATEIAAKLETSLIAIESASQTHKPVTMMKAVVDAMEQARAAYAGETDEVVRSGIPALDQIVPGFYPGELTLIGGRPSMGKSGVALAIALNIARQGQGVAIASLEMTPAAMATRALSEATARQGRGVAYTNMRRGNMSEDEFRTVAEASQHVAKLPITFLPRAYADIGALISGTRQIVRSTQNLSLLIVDYAQLLKADGKSRYDQITEISMALKALAVSANIPVIALSQLSRQIEQREDKRPVMSDLRESGQLEQDADNVFFCYRPEYYLERQKPEQDDLDGTSEWMTLMDKHRHALEIIVAKQRMGQIGTAHVKFAPATNLIWEEQPMQEGRLHGASNWEARE